MKAYTDYMNETQEGLIDLEATNERLWDLYVAICERDKTQPQIKDYFVWLEENYD
jgi:hypothetical protein